MSYSLPLCHAQVGNALCQAPAAESPSDPDEATPDGAVAEVQPEPDAASPAVQSAVLPYQGLLGNVGNLQMDVQVHAFPHSVLTFDLALRTGFDSGSQASLGHLGFFWYTPYFAISYWWSLSEVETTEF